MLLSLAPVGVGACERSPTAAPEPVAAAGPAAAPKGAATTEPPSPTATPSPDSEPSPAVATAASTADAPTSDTAVAAEPTPQELSILADYRAIAPFLGDDDPDTWTPAERRFLEDWLDETDWAWFESNDFSGDTIRKNWVLSMAAQASKGKRSIIRMPLYPNVGWGCEVPSIWVATGDFNPDVAFIVPTGDTQHVDRCEQCFDLEDEQRGPCEDRHCSMQVEGYFTGTSTTPTEGCHEIGYEFHINRSTTRGGTPTRYLLGLAAGAAEPDGPPIDSGPAWGVMFANAFRNDPKALPRAQAKHQAVVDAGHTTAQLLDSRRIPTLWCCSWVVLVERFEHEKGARALARTLGKTALGKPIVRRLY